MKPAVIKAARAAAKIGTTEFRIDPEAVRNRRFEPVGSYPPSGVVHLFLAPIKSHGDPMLVFVVEYDGETQRDEVPISLEEAQAIIGIVL